MNFKFFACHQCRNAWQVGGDPREVAHVLSMVESPPCITPLCRGRMEQVPVAPFGFRPHEIPVENFFRAVNGFGSPEGNAATVKEFTKLIKTRKVVEVKAEASGQPERVILRRLVLDDGTRLHFGVSTKGACCYYIERPGPSCVEVVENALHSETVAGSSAEDREEAGRAVEALTELTDGAREAAASTSPHEQSDTSPMSSVSETGEIPIYTDDIGDGDD